LTRSCSIKPCSPTKSAAAKSACEEIVEFLNPYCFAVTGTFITFERFLFGMEQMPGF
jgi:hypothetical protein